MDRLLKRIQCKFKRPPTPESLEPAASHYSGGMEKVTHIKERKLVTWR